jgi:hypothetical protein
MSCWWDSDFEPLTRCQPPTKTIPPRCCAEEAQACAKLVARDPALLQLQVLRLGFFQDWDVGVYVFPEREKIFVGGKGANPGGVCISSL